MTETSNSKINQYHFSQIHLKRSTVNARKLMELFKEAGLPDGVINYLPGSGREIGQKVLMNKDLAGIHFTGSTKVFQNMWKTVGTNIANYKSYPRIVGETGGKDFILAHESCDRNGLKTAMIRGAFEYQGQKCSAASRAYIPNNLWEDIRKKIIDDVKNFSMGTPEDPKNFINAVISEKAFDKITSYIEYTKKSNDAEIIAGGKYDKSTGYFIEPTVILTKNPNSSI